MTLEPREYETSIAKLVRTRPDLLEIRYNAGCTFTVADVAAVQIMRRKVMGDTPYATLTLIPEDADFQLDTIQVDQSVADRGEGNIIATAVVARASMLEMLVRLYFSYFPQLQRLLVTAREAEAREWIDAQLLERSQTG